MARLSVERRIGSVRQFVPPVTLGTAPEQYGGAFHGVEPGSGTNAFTCPSGHPNSGAVSGTLTSDGSTLGNISGTDIYTGFINGAVGYIDAIAGAGTISIKFRAILRNVSTGLESEVPWASGAIISSTDNAGYGLGVRRIFPVNFSHGITSEGSYGPLVGLNVYCTSPSSAYADHLLFRWDVPITTDYLMQPSDGSVGGLPSTMTMLSDNSDSTYVGLGNLAKNAIIEG